MCSALRCHFCVGETFYRRLDTLDTSSKHGVLMDGALFSQMVVSHPQLRQNHLHVIQKNKNKVPCTLLNRPKNFEIKKSTEIKLLWFGLLEWKFVWPKPNFRYKIIWKRDMFTWRRAVYNRRIFRTWFLKLPNKSQEFWTNSNSYSGQDNDIIDSRWT